VVERRELSCERTGRFLKEEEEEEVL